MAYISTRDGTYYMINDFDDMSNMIYEQLGEEAYHLFNQFANECSREYLQANSDLGSYEASLESNARAFYDITDEVDALAKHIEEAKRINRETLSDGIEQIRTIISNQI